MRLSRLLLPTVYISVGYSPIGEWWTTALKVAGKEVMISALGIWVIDLALALQVCSCRRTAGSLSTCFLYSQSILKTCFHLGIAEGLARCRTMSRLRVCCFVAVVPIFTWKICLRIHSLSCESVSREVRLHRRRRKTHKFEVFWCWSLEGSAVRIAGSSDKPIFQIRYKPPFNAVSRILGQALQYARRESGYGVDERGEESRI